MEEFTYNSKEKWMTLEEFYKKYPNKNPHKPLKYKNLDAYTIE